MEHHEERNNAAVEAANNNRTNNCNQLDSDAAHIVAAANHDNCAAEPEFAHLNAVRQRINRVIVTLNDASFKQRMNRLLLQCERAIREEFHNCCTSPLMCRKLARKLSGLTELIRIIARTLLQTPEYRQRMCDIVALYIACELCAAQESAETQEAVVSRIQSVLWLHVECNDSGEHKEHTLRTLCAIPKLFNRAGILGELYRRLLPQWSSCSVLVQAELPDKLFIQYIIVFYCWLSLETVAAAKERILEFADKFMRPASTLAANDTYAKYLPEYSARRTATRCILEKLQQRKRAGLFNSLRIASVIDSKLPRAVIEDLTADEDEAITCDVLPLSAFVTNADAVPATPNFLGDLLKSARTTESCGRADALRTNEASSQEVIEVQDSDDDVEMFSLDFNVAANVDGNASNDASDATASTQDDSVSNIGLYTSNLRTYERAQSSGQRESSTPSTYAMPCIVNSYSCRRDSINMVSTTSPLLVDQSVQTAESSLEMQANPTLPRESDASKSICVLYSDTMVPAPQMFASSTTTTKVLYAASFDRASSSQSMVQSQQQPSSSNGSASTEAVLCKKQVTFSVQNLGVNKHGPSATSTSTPSIASSIKPAIKLYTAERAVRSTSAMPAPSSNSFESLKWQGRYDHLQAGDNMFNKLSKLCDKQHNSKPPRSLFSQLPKRASLNPLMPKMSSSSKASSIIPPRVTTLLQHRLAEQQQCIVTTTPTSTPGASTTDSANSGDVDKNCNLKKRLFSKVDKGDVVLYNELLNAQRQGLQQRHQRVFECKRTGALAACGKQLALLLSEEQQWLEQTDKRRKRLQRINAALRSDTERLHQQWTVINALKTTPKPVVRLKRLNLQNSVVELFGGQKQQHRSPQEYQQLQCASPKHTVKSKRRKRRHCWAPKTKNDHRQTSDKKTPTNLELNFSEPAIGTAPEPALLRLLRKRSLTLDGGGRPMVAIRRRLATFL